jgi:hypothetical protein
MAAKTPAGKRKNGKWIASAGFCPTGLGIRKASKMINCRNCINWADESLEQIEAAGGSQNRIFMGCRIFGFLDNNAALESCRHYVQSENLFTLCSTCRISVPKVCVSLGECVNCTDTDLFCVDHCMGGDSRKYCTHFVRLHTEGVHLISEDQAFDLFPSIGMPGKEKEPSGTGENTESDSGDAEDQNP